MQFRLLLASIIFAMPSTIAQAGLLTNGDFQTGDLSGWTTFVNGANGTIGTPTVTTFDVTGAGASQAARFQVGNIQNPGNNGGGLFQNIAHTGGDLNVSVDIAVNNISGSGNADAGEFSLLIGGTLVDFHNFGSISGLSSERSNLSGTINNLAAGIYDFRVLMTRSFQTNSTTPFQYVDNAVATSSGVVPEPSSIMICSILGLLGIRFRKAKG